MSKKYVLEQLRKKCYDSKVVRQCEVYLKVKLCWDMNDQRWTEVTKWKKIIKWKKERENKSNAKAPTERKYFSKQREKTRKIDVTVVTLQALSYDVHERPSTSC